MLANVRFAVRQLLKNPAFTVVAVLTLALGIGVNTTIFSALQSLLLPHLPYPEPDRLVRLFHTTGRSDRGPHSVAGFMDQKEQNTVFERMAAYSSRSFNLAAAGQPPERVSGLAVTADLIPLLGLPPLVGRGFTAEEDQPGRNQVVLLSHGFWTRRFSADPIVVGRTLRLDGESVTVIGVLPPGFQDRLQWGPVELLRPIAFTGEQRQNRGGYWLDSIARLKSGVSLTQAQAAVTALAAGLRREHPEIGTDAGIRLATLATAQMNPQGRIMLSLIMGLSGFVLLIACANLANLQFARMSARSREFAIRSALGAPRHRVLHQVLLESLVIALLGGAVGILLSAAANRLMSRLIVLDGEAVLNLSLNPSVLGFGLVVATLTGLAFGLAPAWYASRADVNAGLKQGSRGTTSDPSQNRIRQALIIAEVALALILLAGTGVFLSGLRNFGERDPGWRVDGLSLGYLSLPEAKYSDGRQQSEFARQLQEKLAVLPGVEKAAVAHYVPVSSFRTSAGFEIEDQAGTTPGQQQMRTVNTVTPGYFDTLGMRLVAGRDFTPLDAANRAPVVIINETTARTFWPGQSAVGERLGNPGGWREVIGVVNDAAFPSDPSEPRTRFQSYVPLNQEPSGDLALIVRGQVPAEALRRVVAELDPDLPISQAGTARAAVEEVLTNASAAGWVLAGCAGLGLFLAAIGLYGVIAGYVLQRTAEIGVRLALGARVQDIHRLVLGKGMSLTLIGAVVGSIGALGLARILRSVLPGLESNSFGVVATVALLLSLVALLACWLPSRRATQVDPVIALRGDG